MRIEKYDSGGLKKFLKSELYGTMPFVPVSEHRALSWLNNPRLIPGDVIMYIGFDGDEMIGYRCILPDHYREVRFGWLSGNWVRPDQRRRGLATQLLEEAYADWGHQLMYTNYAPESKAVYDKSGHFRLYRGRAGVRYYRRSATASLLGNRSTVFRRSRMLLSVADGILNLVQDIRIKNNKTDIGDLNFEENSRIDLEALDFLEKNGGTGFCERGTEDFDWITDYPWLRPGPEKDKRYFFSSIAPVFRNICLKVRDQGGGMGGFLWLVLKGDVMTIPYAVLNPGMEHAISSLLSHYLQVNRISHLTTYQSPVIDIFNPGPILGRHKMIQNYFATPELIRQLPDPESLNFQDGDGDVVFV